MVSLFASKEKLEKFIEKNVLFEFELSIRKKRTRFLKIKGEKELEKNVFVLFESEISIRYI